MDLFLSPLIVTGHFLHLKIISFVEMRLKLKQDTKALIALCQRTKLHFSPSHSQLLLSASLQ